MTTSAGSWRVHADPAAAASLRSRPLVKLTSVALVGLVCLLGCVALHHHAQVHTTSVVASASSAGYERVSAAIVPVPVQARKQFLAKAQSEAAEVTIPDIAAHFNDAQLQQAVSRKELKEVSDMISTAIRANKNHMDVRVLQEIIPGDSPKPCGPKRPPSNAPRLRPPRPCIPTPPIGPGVCSLCVVYRYPVTNANAPTACDPPNPANFLNILNIALLNGFPELFGKIGEQTPNCTVGKPLGGQQQYAINGKYCVGPFPPDYTPQVESALMKVTAELQGSDTVAKLATAESACSQAQVQESTSTVVGKETQELTVTLECDNVPEPALFKTFAASCPAAA